MCLRCWELCVVEEFFFFFLFLLSCEKRTKKSYQHEKPSGDNDCESCLCTTSLFVLTRSAGSLSAESRFLISEPRAHWVKSKMLGAHWAELSEIETIISIWFSDATTNWVIKKPIPQNDKTVLVHFPFSPPRGRSICAWHIITLHFQFPFCAPLFYCY